MPAEDKKIEALATEIMHIAATAETSQVAVQKVPEPAVAAAVRAVSAAAV
jgi:hypothetical protein